MLRGEAAEAGDGHRSAASKSTVSSASPAEYHSRLRAPVEPHTLAG